MRYLYCGVIFTLVVADSEAHQPFESSTIVRIVNSSLELNITLSTDIAERLTTEEAEPLAPTPRKSWREVAQSLFEIDADGKRLTGGQVFAKTQDTDAVLSIVYDLPTLPQEIKIHASYLKKLQPGYGGQMEVIGVDGRLLARALLLHRQPDLDTITVHLSKPESKPEAFPMAPKMDLSQNAAHAEIRIPLLLGIISIMALLRLGWQRLLHRK